MQSEELDAMLTESNPVSSLDPELSKLARHMAKESAPKRPKLRLLTIGALVAASLGGGAVAAAAAGYLWSPWAENDTFARIDFTLPSGTSCEMRYGDLTGAPDGVKAILDKAFANYRVTPAEVQTGAEYFDLTQTQLKNDDDYVKAVRWAAILHGQKALRDSGIDKDYQFSLEGHCSE